MPTSPTIAETLGLYGIWIVLIIFLIVVLAVKFGKPLDSQHSDGKITPPWIRQDRK